jgi:Tfp pilus assembly protein PilF
MRRPAEALPYLQKANEIEPTASTWVEIAMAQQLLDLDMKAGMSYQRALKLNPDYASAHYGMGCLLAGQGRSAEAVPYLQKAIENAPGEAGYRVGLGMALLNAGQLPAARQVLEEAVQLEPNLESGWFYLGQLWLKSGDRQKATACLAQAAELGHPEAQAMFSRP